MTFYYFITVDKVFGNTKPTRADFNKIVDCLCERFYLEQVYPNVDCLEYKEKGSLRKKTKVYDWPHYHGIFKCFTDYIKGAKTFLRGYSIKVEELQTLGDVARTAGYIQKRMIDEIDNPAIIKTNQQVPTGTFKNVWNEYAFEDSSDDSPPVPILHRLSMEKGGINNKQIPEHSEV